MTAPTRNVVRPAPSVITALSVATHTATIGRRTCVTVSATAHGIAVAASATTAWAPRAADSQGTRTEYPPGGWAPLYQLNQ